MALHLNVGNTAVSTEATGTGSTLAAGKSNGNFTFGNGTNALNSHSQDSVAVSSASSAFATSFADRAVRVGQLAAAVQNGTYHVSGASISRSIVADAASSQSIISGAAAGPLGSGVGATA